jgi:Ca2+-binding RTX toxin-like protein
MMLAILVGALPVAHANHVPDCFGRHPTNTPTAGDDFIVGTPGEDVLAGGPGDDHFRGLDGSDSLCGNEGNDTISGDQGFDGIEGGLGDDKLGGDIAFTNCDVQTSQRPGLSNGGNTIHGSDGDDLITGAGDFDSLHGENGDDCLMGLHTGDSIHGDSGSDSIFAGGGEDQATGGDDYDDIFGQDDNDKLYASTVFTGPIPEWPQTCKENGELMGVSGPAESGDSEVTPTPPQWPYFGPANELFGGDGYDDLVGAARKDVMWGNERGDDLYGLGDNDLLVGNRASDCLSGGTDGDRLFDRDGPTEAEQLDDRDTLWGADGLDYLDARDFDNFDTVDGGPPFSRFENCYADGTIIVGDVVRDCARRIGL